MKSANLHQAKTQLSRLVDAALMGEEVIIARAGKPLVRLVPVEAPKQARELGLDAGKVRIREDFDDPMPELEELFYGQGEIDPS
ncbi:MAG: type II toxin-antitoxin system Phd/YefM family antitoxin [Acidobacteria bacterium]|nr:type II toxin-antitoxin system Phd/YefM family antitoxin [Acidobacteriota bacterium]